MMQHESVIWQSETNGIKICYDTPNQTDFFIYVFWQTFKKKKKQSKNILIQNNNNKNRFFAPSVLPWFPN